MLDFCSLLEVFLMTRNTLSYSKHDRQCLSVGFEYQTPYWKIWPTGLEELIDIEE